MRRALCALVVTALLAVLAAGCTNDPGSTTTTTYPRASTTSPGEELTPDPELAADRAATQAYKNFIDAYNQVGQAGYTNHDEQLVWRFAHGDYIDTLFDELDPLAMAGAHQTGEVKLSAFKVVDRKTDGPDSTIVLEVCEDTSDFDVVRPDGSSMLIPETTGRYVTTVEMWRLSPVSPDDVSSWSVASASTDRGRPC